MQNDPVRETGSSENSATAEKAIDNLARAQARRQRIDLSESPRYHLEVVTERPRPDKRDLLVIILVRFIPWLQLVRMDGRLLDEDFALLRWLTGGFESRQRLRPPPQHSLLTWTIQQEREAP